MGYLVTTSIVGQKIEYRDAVRAVGAARQRRARRGDPLLDAERDEQPPDRSRAVPCCSTASVAIGLGVAVPRLHLLALHADRAGAVEAQAPQARQAAGARERSSRPVAADARRRARSSRATSRPSRWAQFITPPARRGQAGADQPGLIVLCPARDRLHRRRSCGSANRNYGTSDHPTVVGDDPERRGGSSHLPAHDRRFLRRRAGVARARPQAQRDHRFHRRSRAG